ncbi:MAG: acetate--CoA ligase family protein [Rubrivivax sp.]
MAALPATATVAELMRPRSVAVIGASEDQGKFGGRLYRSLLAHGYAGEVYPINPVRETLLGRRAFPSVAATPEAPDLVVMAVPRDKVRGEIEAAARRGARGAIIITAKFADAGPEGAALERELVTIARAHGMRLIGPNCLGLISPAHGVVLCSSPALEVDRLPVGRVGMVSQSGALMATLFDRAMAAGLGFSHAVSVGNQADLEATDVVEFLIDDPATQVICSYVEGVKDPARFVAAAARARAAGKPWLLVKAGRTEAGQAAAFSHTASIAGSHAVFAAVCREEGLTLLDEPGAMLALAAMQVQHPAAAVRRVAVVTTSGGGGALAADALAARGVALARFTPETRTRLDAFYPSDQAHNPIDLGGRRFDEAADVAQHTVRIVADDAGTDALLVPITTAPMLQRLAGELADGLMAGPDGHTRKPAIVVMQPGRAGDAARQVLRERGVPFTDASAEAVDALCAWAARSAAATRRAAHLWPGWSAPARPPSGEHDEAATKAWLAAAGVPVNSTEVARTRDAAIAAAARLGFPVVMKVASPDVVHKSDVGGVRLGLRDAEAVGAAFDAIVASVRAVLPQARLDGVAVQSQVNGALELIVGARRDAQFGPVLVIGAGGLWVDLLPQRVLLRAPVARDDAHDALRALPVWPVLAGARGTPLAVDAVLDAIERVGWLAHALAGQDFELDLNPLIVGPGGCTAVDARLRIA